MGARRPRRSFLVLFAALLAVFALASCGGDSDSDEPMTGEEAAAAFEDAADGYPFVKTTTLVEGATAYAPDPDGDPSDMEVLNDALGEGSILWQVLVFEGPDAPPDEVAAAKAAAFASKTFEEISDGVYLGESDIAYIPNGNVVVTGPALDGDPEDETLLTWKEVVDGL